MRRILALMVLLICIFTLSGCRIMPTSITADEYIETAEELGYSVKEWSEEELDDGQERYVEITSFPSYEMTFIEYANEQDAIKRVKSFKYYSCGNDISRPIAFGNSDKIACKLDAQFNYICRVGNTVARFEGSDAYKPEAMELIRAIGY